MQPLTLLCALLGAAAQPLPCDLSRFPDARAAELGLRRAEGHLVWIEAMRASGYPQLRADLDAWERRTQRQVAAWLALHWAHSWSADTGDGCRPVRVCESLVDLRRLVGEDAWHAGRMPGLCPRWSWRGPLLPPPWPWTGWPW